MNGLLLLPLHKRDELRSSSSTVLNLCDDLLPGPWGITRKCLDGDSSFVGGRTAFGRKGREGLEFWLGACPIEVREQLLGPLRVQSHCLLHEGQQDPRGGSRKDPAEVLEAGATSEQACRGGAKSQEEVGVRLPRAWLGARMYVRFAGCA